MNSNYGRSTESGGAGFDFDLGINTNRSGSLNEQKNNKPSYSSSSSYLRPNTSSSWQPNRPSWTHQPAPSQQSTMPTSLSGPTSMVGDISGRSWASSAPSSASPGIGIVNKNPNLFSDLLGPALGQNSKASNVPLKNAAPLGGNKSAYSMGGMADSLPKTSVKSSGPSYGNEYNSNKSSHNVNVGYNKSATNLGGPSMKSSGGSGGVGGGISLNKDPFGSLVDFRSKPAPSSMNTGSKGSSKTEAKDDGFGDFQNASKSNTSAFSSNAFPASNNSSTGSGMGSYSNMGDFGFSSTPNQPPVQQPSGGDDFDMLFTPASGGATAKGTEELASQQFSGGDDWGDFGGGNDVGGTTELDGLPPPPAGVSASTAKNKGMDNYKAGQYPDAVKWLSWAIILLEKASDNNGVMEVLSSRASCYKEVGEYKKAVADCTKVLEQDNENVVVLVQRALLYESMEKYKLGAEDLRTVMKLDPGNRVAKSTIHRLIKMAE